MLSFGEQIDIAEKGTGGGVTAAITTFLKQQINEGKKILEAALNNFEIEDSRGITTVTSTNEYELPENFIRLTELYVTVGTNQYTARKIEDETLWRSLMAAGNTQTGDQLMFVFVRGKTFEVYPKFATAGLTMTMIYEGESRDLYYDDVSATITALTNGAKAVTGSGTAFDATYIGRYLKIDTNTQWYEIAGFTNTTSMALRKNYQGTTISTSVAGTIGDIMKTPSATHIIPVHYALWQYYTMIKRDLRWSKHYENLFEGGSDRENKNYGIRWAVRTYGKRYSSGYIPGQRLLRMGIANINANWFPAPLT